jgi:histidyl-tRNA synthetase
MAIIQPQTLKGFRDFLPADMRRRDFVAKKIKTVFELFGFEPLETPTLEYASLLLGKYGKEADKLIYSFKDRGGREIALRFDQTVPSARILAQYQKILPKYFRRYQIQNVYRADKPQAGRYREFTQCDIDIFGSSSPIADAEIIAATYFAFKNVGYKKIILTVNDRQILFDKLQSFSSNKLNIFSIIQSVDKLQKIGKENVIKELIKKGLTKDRAQNALKTIESSTPTPNLKGIINYSIKLGVPKEVIQFSPTLARGLDYYTGMIFEVILPEFSRDSCGGGGRYDKLIAQLGGTGTPAVGIAFGFDRMVEAAEKLGIIPSENVGIQVLVTIFNQAFISNSLMIADNLRQAKINTEVYPAVDKLDKQLKYADKKGIPYVVIIGPDEAKKNVVKLKNMKTGDQKELTTSQLVNLLTRQ